MANPSVTYTFSNSTTADASQVNQNFTDLINSMTDGTKDFSISALTCAGNATLNGNTTIGNASSDDLTITASLASSIVIKTNATYSVGSATKGWLAEYFSNSGTNTTKLQGTSSLASDVTITLPSATGTLALAARHEIVLTNGNGHGSVATKIRRWTTTQTNTGSDLTLTQDAANGDKITVNSAGLYAIFYVDSAGAAYNTGISINASSLTTDINNLSYANGMRIAIAESAANFRREATLLIWLSANDIIRAHDDGQCNSTADSSTFRVVRVL